jgi:hypothetical protein
VTLAANTSSSRQMLVSRDRDLWAEIDPERVRAGRFLTEADSWLAPQVVEFIVGAGHRHALDPFAGAGDLLRHVQALGLVDEVSGIDIAGAPNQYGDSLAHIGSFDGLVVTNPPYLARHSAKRKRVFDEVARYFDATGWFDLYQVALERMLAAASHVVAILPETFLHTGTFRERLQQVTVLERRHPFVATSCPAIVACFGPEPVAVTQVWVDDRLVGDMRELDAVRHAPFTRPRSLRFNDPAGRIGLRAVDGALGTSPIAFMPGSELEYGVDGIKHSSRLMTRIGIDAEVSDVDVVVLCERANELLAATREGIGNLALSPFKGNDKLGRRRRRIDYRQAARMLVAANPDTFA